MFELAETGGFEPPVEFNPDPSLAVKSVRPLRHVSIREQRQQSYPTEATQWKSTPRRGAIAAECRFRLIDRAAR